MKKLVLSWMVLCFLFNPIPFVYAGEYDDLPQYGFKLIEDNTEKLHLSFQDTKNIIISKERFKSSAEAIQFCKQQSIPLGHIETALLLAMSGVSNSHDFIKNAIVFSFTEPSDFKTYKGIWTWSKIKDNVTLMLDGHGTETLEATLAEISEALQTEVTLPALCSNDVFPKSNDWFKKLLSNRHLSLKITP